MIDLNTGEVMAKTATDNDILLDSDIILDSDGIFLMQYVVSDPDPDVGGGTQGTMGVPLTESKRWGGCGTRLL